MMIWDLLHQVRAAVHSWWI